LLIVAAERQIDDILTWDKKHYHCSQRARFKVHLLVEWWWHLLLLLFSKITLITVKSVEPLKTTWNITIFLSNSLCYWKAYCFFWKFPAPLLLIVGVILNWRRVWNIDRMILAQGNRNAPKKKSVPVPYCPTLNFKWTDSGFNPLLRIEKSATDRLKFFSIMFKHSVLKSQQRHRISIIEI
jgi:hypothetical protein